MNSEQRKALSARLANMSGQERKQIYRQAAELRMAAQARREPGRDLEYWMAKILDSGPGSGAPTVVTSGRDAAWVESEGDVVMVRFHPRLTGSGLHPVAGDRVRLDSAHPPRITEVLPRRTGLYRPSPGGNSLLAITANLDIAVIVVSVFAPPLHPRLVDRVVAAVRQGGAEPVVAVNKVDLAPDESCLGAELRKLDPVRQAEIPVVPVSAEAQRGLIELGDLVRGRTAAFVGHSGVGKSSIVRALWPDAEAITGHVNAKTGRGRHTTTASTLYRMLDGTALIDTPGFRVFGADSYEDQELQMAFPEIAEFGLECRFSDCRHDREPGCAVRSAVVSGRLAPVRYAAYRRLAGLTDEEEEPFECKWCGGLIRRDGAGTRHRNHCPHCLFSLHVDHLPGDRASGCGGLMEPISVWVRKGGEWAIIHRCRSCGELSSNRIAGDDNPMLLMSLAARPMAQPPFPLDRVESAI